MYTYTYSTNSTKRTRVDVSTLTPLIHGVQDVHVHYVHRQFTGYEARIHLQYVGDMMYMYLHLKYMV